MTKIDYGRTGNGGKNKSFASDFLFVCPTCASALLLSSLFRTMGLTLGFSQWEASSRYMKVGGVEFRYLLS